MSRLKTVLAGYGLLFLAAMVVSLIGARTQDT